MSDCQRLRVGILRALNLKLSVPRRHCEFQCFQIGEARSEPDYGGNGVPAAKPSVNQSELRIW